MFVAVVVCGLRLGFVLICVCLRLFSFVVD